MDDGACVRERNRLTNAQKEPEHFRRGSAAVAECSAAHELHSVEDTPIGQRARVVKGNDSWMFQVGDHTGLRTHAFLGRRRGDLRGQNFDRYPALQLEVVRLIDDAHPSPGQLAHDSIARRAKVGLVRDGAQMCDGFVGKPRHTSTPRSDRTSRRNSSSEAVASRRTSRTSSRNRRRVAASRFVTVVSLIPS